MNVKKKKKHFTVNILYVVKFMRNNSSHNKTEAGRPREKRNVMGERRVGGNIKNQG